APRSNASALSLGPGRTPLACARAAVVQLPELTLAVAGDLEELAGQLDGRLLGVGLEDGQAADHPLPFRGGAVRHRRPTLGEANARTRRAGHAPLDGQERARLHPLLDELAHSGHLFGSRQVARLHALVDAQEPHSILLGLDVSPVFPTPATSDGRRD